MAGSHSAALPHKPGMGIHQTRFITPSQPHRAKPLGRSFSKFLNHTLSGNTGTVDAARAGARPDCLAGVARLRRQHHRDAFLIGRFLRLLKSLSPYSSGCSSDLRFNFHTDTSADMKKASSSPAMAATRKLCSQNHNTIVSTKAVDSGLAAMPERHCPSLSKTPFTLFPRFLRFVALATNITLGHTLIHAVFISFFQEIA